MTIWPFTHVPLCTHHTTPPDQILPPSPHDHQTLRWQQPACGGRRASSLKFSPSQPGLSQTSTSKNRTWLALQTVSMCVLSSRSTWLLGFKHTKHAGVQAHNKLLSLCGTDYTGDTTLRPAALLCEKQLWLTLCDWQLLQRSGQQTRIQTQALLGHNTSTLLPRL